MRGIVGADSVVWRAERVDDVARSYTRLTFREEAAMTMTTLTEFEERLLAFEETHPRHTHAKADAARKEFGLSPARYYQTLSNLLDTPAALVDHAQLVGRLTRLRDERRLRRSSERRTHEGHPAL